jgi:class 3 adenylate cyclase
VVEPRDGHVADLIGGDVLACFVWPRAHEDDAERAVRAGLELTERIAGLTGSGGAPLAARVGLATGLVMVGDLIGEGAAATRTVIGGRETPNGRRVPMPPPLMGAGGVVTIGWRRVLPPQGSR